MMKKLLTLSVLSLGLFATTATAVSVSVASGATGAAASASSASAGAGAVAAGSSASYSRSERQRDDALSSALYGDTYGVIDGQTPDKRVELTTKHKAGECKAKFIKTINRGDEVTVLKTSHEPGGIMERYYIKEQGGRWYYASHFSAIRCN